VARRTFGGGPADFVATVDTGGLLHVSPLLTCTAWTARSGGTQITDLQDMSSNAISSVQTDLNGLLPQFQGPNTGADTLWIDGGAGSGSRVLLLATDLSSEFAQQSALASYLTSAAAATTYLTQSAAGSTYAPLASPSFTGGITVGGHILTGGSTPTLAAGSNAGTSPPTPTLAAGTPNVMLTPRNAATAALNDYVAAVSSSSFTIGLGTAPTASQSVGTYLMGYAVVG
jgi:hypothetical protein